MGVLVRKTNATMNIMLNTLLLITRTSNDYDETTVR